ncbi:MAG: ATP-binding protein, partial [Lentisphaerae bacterium]|nr:ATP-binding protein [Lentisphaerota bacterium]
VEFKEMAVNKDKQDLSGGTAIARSVAGFMNSLSGGVLLIGVRDDGSIRGVDPDYPLVDKGKGNWDGFYLFLNNLLRMRLSAENPFLFYTIERRKAMDHDVCVVRVKPAPKPVYLDKHLFVRSGAQTIEMLGPDLVHYVATRWPQ